MIKDILLLIFLSFLITSCTNAPKQEFIDKRFYAKMNPITAKSWIQLTPDSILIDKNRSYWFKGGIRKPKIHKKKCKLLENKIGYLKYECIKENNQTEIINFTIQQPDVCVENTVRVNYSGDYNKYFWIPDGSKSSDNYDISCPFTFENNNAYKESKNICQ